MLGKLELVMEAKMSRHFHLAFIPTLIGVLTTAAAAIDVTPAQVCQAGQMIAATKYAYCRATAEKKLVQTGDTAKYALRLGKCDLKFAVEWAKLDAKTAAQGASCPTATQQPALMSFVATHADFVAAALSAGGQVPTCGDNAVNVVGEQCDGSDLGGESCLSLGFDAGALSCDGTCQFDTSACPFTLNTCGNSIVEAPEQCDSANLNGQSCVSLGFPLGGTVTCAAGCYFNVGACLKQSLVQTGQTSCWDSGHVVIDPNDPDNCCPPYEASRISCNGTGHDGEFQLGAQGAFVDNGNGTITDLNTKLVWAKKSNDGSIHDRDNRWTWADAFAVYVAGLNAANFGGHNDWRLPNINELMSLRDMGNSQSALPDIFRQNCPAGCTVLTCSCSQMVNPTPLLPPTAVYAFNSNWSSTTLGRAPDVAFILRLDDGFEGTATKSHYTGARAVRGGL